MNPQDDEESARGSIRLNTRRRAFGNIEASNRDDIPSQFLEAVYGPPSSAKLQVRQQDFLRPYYKVVRTFTRSWSTSYLPGIIPSDQKLDQLLLVLRDVSEIIRKSERLTVNSIRAELRENNPADTHSVVSRLKDDTLSELIFNLIDVMTMLYSPYVFTTRESAWIASSSEERFRSDISGSRLLAGVLRGMDQILPSKPQNSPSAFEYINVSAINADVLVKIGYIGFEWTLNVGWHLRFDSDTRVLWLFALLSFCESFKEGSSLLSNIADVYYDEEERPDGFSVEGLFKEILRSYEILFRHDSKSRELYRKIEVKKMRRLLRDGDPHLDQLCDGPVTGSPRMTYSKSETFPIHGERLGILQAYMQEQRPEGFVGVLRDRRDLTAWYTAWPNVMIAVFALFLAIVQTVSGVIQTVYTVRSASKS